MGLGELPVLLIGTVIGSYLGTALSNWIKVKLGWMDPLPKKKKVKRGKV